MTTIRLTKEDWIMSAIQLIADCGMESLSIDRLAIQLKVTKGSFYWHFKDRNDLIKNILMTWEKQATKQIISQLENLPNAKERLHRLFHLIWNNPHEMHIELALISIKDNHDAKIIIDRVHQQRLKFLMQTYQLLGLNNKEAKQWATTTYSIYLGTLYMTQITPQFWFSQKNLRAYAQHLQHVLTQI